jgi:diaminopropionate ammonia-lyase
MAGLACGEPCTIGWNVLSECADFFVSCPDYAAAAGMRILANPAGKDERIISGESGASAFGCMTEIMRDPALSGVKKQLGLDEQSRVLCFSTEGDTDKANYKAIVWDGCYSKSSERK